MLKKILQSLLRLKETIELFFCDEYSAVDFYRKKKGVNIGKHCRIMDKKTDLFSSEPYLIKIGDRVTISDGVRFVTHDGGVGILRDQNPGLNVFGKIVIHDNCFIGTRSILMPNVIIGPNAIVGAGAVVTHNVSSGTVVAGVPARVIMSVEEYRRKALDKGMTLTSRIPAQRKSEILNGLKLK